MVTVEIAFQVVASEPATVPVDHAHALWGGVKNAVPELASCGHVGIHSLRGAPLQNGQILLDTKKTKLVFRLPLDSVPKALPLAGHVLRIHNAHISVGTCSIAPIVPAKTLWARMVTRKFDGHDEKIARNALQKDIQKAYPNAKFTIDRTRTIRIHQKQILGFEVWAEGLSDDDSIELQSTGFGGRRAFGCGIFIVKDKK
jgi:CRISPR-associated protein Cas6